jgi:hypothetical protein
MKSLRQPVRIVAVDLRPRRFGFVVLESNYRLLDWGVRGYPSTSARSAVLKKRILPVLRIFSPAMLVLKKHRMDSIQKSETRFAAAVLRHEALCRGMRIETLSVEEIRQAFPNTNSSTKYDIAAKLGLMFPELKWRIPPHRKPWEPEHYTRTMFDAAALGVAYLKRLAQDSLVC